MPRLTLTIMDREYPFDVSDDDVEPLKEAAELINTRAAQVRNANRALTAERVAVMASLQIAFHYLSIMAVCLPILYLLYIYRSGLMGLGDTVVPMVSGIAEMIVRMGVVLLLPLVMGQEGVYYAEVGAWTAAALILAGAYYLRIRALSRRKGFALDEKGGDLR